MKNYRFDRNDYYFHRTDPTPWIPIEEEKKMDWKEICLWIVAVLMILVWLGLGSLV